jgi:hypothetical protein
MVWITWAGLGINLVLLGYAIYRLYLNSQVLASLGTSLFSSLALRQDALNREESLNKQLLNLAETASTLARVVGKDQPLSPAQVEAQAAHMKLLEARREARKKEVRPTFSLVGVHSSHGLPPLNPPSQGVLNAGI